MSRNPLSISTTDARGTDEAVSSMDPRVTTCLRHRLGVPRARQRRRSHRPPGRTHTVPARVAEPADDLPCGARVHELALRTALLAVDGGTARPVAPHDRPVHFRSGCAATALRRRGQQLLALCPGSCQAVHRRERRGLRHRRRDPVLPRRGSLRSRRLAHGARLGRIHRRDRRLRRRVPTRLELDRPRPRHPPGLLPI